MTNKTLDNLNVAEAKAAISDLKTFGDGDMWTLIGKASSNKQGWMKSTKAMEIEGIGVLVQATTQQADNVAEALTFVPGASIDRSDKENPRLVKA